MDPIALATFTDAFQDWLEAELAQQQTGLQLTGQLTAALIACDQPRILSASEALVSWEHGHRGMLQRAEALQRDWQAIGGVGPLGVSAVVLAVQGSASAGTEWRLAEIAGELTEVLIALAAQTELNQLLIAQHADVIHQTYAAIVQAVHGSAQHAGYAVPGHEPPAHTGAALLDARG